VVLSMGHEVVGLGYSRVKGVAARVIDKGENLGNHGQVNRVSKMEQYYLSQVNQVSHNSSMDRQADWVGQATRVSPNSSTDRRTYQVSWVNRARWVGNTEHKKGGSSRVANMESRVMENSVNTKNRVVQDSGGQETGRRKRCCSKQNASSTVVPKGYYHDT
jgi:hypothetical protein